MAGHVLKKRRLTNAGRKRRMTAKQIKYFGTKRQRASLRNRGRRNAAVYKSTPATRADALRKMYAAQKPRKRRRNQGGIISQAEHAAQRAIHAVEQAAEDAIGTVTRQVNRGGRRKNVGEILTVLPAANPGRRRRKAVATKTRRRTNRGRFTRTRNRRRANRGVARHRRRNSPRVVVRYRNRRHRRTHNRRRNQGVGGFLTGDIGKVVGVLGGAIITGLITGFLPATLTGGPMGMLATGVTALVLGQVAGRFMKNRSLGTFVTVGGLLLVALPLLSQFFPTLSLPFTTAGTAGMGLITSSNFFVPQVNVPGSMASFIAPAAIAAQAPMAVPASTLRGLGQGASPLIGLRSARRTGRLR